MWCMAGRVLVDMGLSDPRVAGGAAGQPPSDEEVRLADAMKALDRMFVDDRDPGTWLPEEVLLAISRVATLRSLPEGTFTPASNMHKYFKKNPAAITALRMQWVHDGEVAAAQGQVQDLEARAKAAEEKQRAAEEAAKKARDEAAAARAAVDKVNEQMRRCSGPDAAEIIQTMHEHHERTMSLQLDKVLNPDAGMSTLVQRGLVTKYVGGSLATFQIHPSVVGIVAMALYNRPDYELSEIAIDFFTPEVWELARPWVVKFVHETSSRTRRLRDFIDPAGRPQFPRPEKYGFIAPKAGPSEAERLTLWEEFHAMRMVFTDAEEFKNLDVFWNQVELWASRPGSYHKMDVAPCLTVRRRGGSGAHRETPSARRPVPRRGRQGGSRGADGRHCYICQEVGHLAAHCPEKNGPAKQDAHKDGSKPSAGKKHP